MRLVSVTELLLEGVRVMVIDIQIDEVDLISILSFQPVHDGGQRPATRSPESKKFDKLWFPGSQSHRARVGRVQVEA
jgi:hypothetical protein